MAPRNLVALALCLATEVAGFLMVPHQTSTTALSAMSKSIPFLTAPKGLDGYIGNEEFDPLGFAEDWDIKYMREAELKHGRVAMLAIVGAIAPEFGFHLPGEAFSHTNPIKAALSVPPSAWATLIFFAGVIESVTNKGSMTYLDMFTDPKRVPGDFGYDPPKIMTPENEADYKLKELTHCRLAMIAIGGLLHGSFVTGTGVFGNPTF